MDAAAVHINIGAEEILTPEQKHLKGGRRAVLFKTALLVFCAIRQFNNAGMPIETVY